MSDVNFLPRLWQIWDSNCKPTQQIAEEWKTILMSLAILFHLLCAQHVSDINMSIFRSLRLCWWITTSVVLFSVRCVLQFLLRLIFGVVRVAGWSSASTCNIPQLNSRSYDQRMPTPFSNPGTGGNQKSLLRFECSTIMNIQKILFCVMTLVCDLMGCYLCYRGKYVRDCRARVWFVCNVLTLCQK